MMGGSGAAGARADPGMGLLSRTGVSAEWAAPMGGAGASGGFGLRDQRAHMSNPTSAASATPPAVRALRSLMRLQYQQP
jgi:hypothetical protein